MISLALSNSHTAELRDEKTDIRTKTNRSKAQETILPLRKSSGLLPVFRCSMQGRNKLYTTRIGSKSQQPKIEDAMDVFRAMN